MELLSEPEVEENYLRLGKQLHRLVDQTLAGVDKSEADCQRGCGYCCNSTIFLPHADVGVLNNFLNDRFGAEKQAQITVHLQNRHELTKDLDRPKHTFYRCPFLGKDQDCGAYEARPVICRIHYSTDVGFCKRFMGRIYNTSSERTVGEALQKGWAVVNGYRAAAKVLGHPTEMVTMEAGLLAAQKEGIAD
ncbi:MAG: hypothetical protein GY705_00245 [Bacteroidetes bacterium]|nr:hypothetical protein [Bacteroidota bacterium]